MVDPESILGTLGTMQGYTLEGTLGYYKAPCSHTHTFTHQVAFSVAKFNVVYWHFCKSTPNTKTVLQSVML